LWFYRRLEVPRASRSTAWAGSSCSLWCCIVFRQIFLRALGIITPGTFQARTRRSQNQRSSPAGRSSLTGQLLRTVGLLRPIGVRRKVPILSLQPPPRQLLKVFLGERHDGTPRDRPQQGQEPEHLTCGPDDVPAGSPGAESWR